MDQYYQAIEALAIQHRSGTEDCSHQIAQKLSEWKSCFSLAWYQKHCKSQPQALENVWRLLLNLTVDVQNSQVQLRVYNAIGALLVTLAPFYLVELQRAFKIVLDECEVLPRRSIAIVSTFTFMARRIAPHKVGQFICDIPVLHHFGADMKSFIKYVPSLIDQMAFLPLDFHQALLRSLIASFGRAPDPNVVDSLLCLLERYPVPLVNDLMEFIKSNDLTLTLLAVGKPILSRPELAHLLSKEQKEAMFQTAVKVLNEEENGTTEVEQAAGIISQVLRDEDAELKQRAKEAADIVWSRGMKSHIKRLVLQIAQSFDLVRPSDEDSAPVVAAKISGFVNFMPEHSSEIVDICCSLLTRTDEGFTATVEFLAKFPTLLTKQMEKTTPILVELLTRDGYSWVQRNAMLRLIDGVNQFAVAKYCPEYYSLVVDFLVTAAVSPQSDLSRNALEVVEHWAGLNNVELFIAKILGSDLFDSRVVEKLMLLINRLMVPAPFPAIKKLVPLVMEVISLYSDQRFIHWCFKFLSVFPKAKEPKKLIRICAKQLQQYYWSFTQLPLLSNSCSDLEAFGPILKNSTSDIVGGSDLASYEILEPIKNLFAFLTTWGANYEYLEAVTFGLVRLIPYEAIRKCMKSYASESKNVQILLPHVEQLLDTVNDPALAQLCCDFFFEFGHSESAQASLEDMLKTRSQLSGANAYSLWRCLTKTNPERSAELFITLVNGLEPIPKVQFVVHAWCSDRKSVPDSVYELYPFLYVGVKPDTAVRWLNEHSVCEWPINITPKFDEDLVQALDAAGVKSTIPEPGDVSYEQWHFIMRNPKIFNDKCIKSFARLFAGQNKLKRLLHFTREFHYKWEDLEAGLDTTPTVGPHLRRGIIPSSDLLISNFLLYSNAKISQETFDKVCQEKENLRKQAKKYAQRTGLRYNISDICGNFQDIISSFTMKSRYLREACGQALSLRSEKLEILRMLVMEHSNELKSPKRWFFFLRFLRLTTQKGGDDDMKTAVYSKITAERLPTILKSFDIDAAFVVDELCHLVKSVMLSQVNTLAETCPALNRLRDMDDTEPEMLDIPSRIIDVFRTSDRFKKSTLKKFIEEHRDGFILKNMLVAEKFVDFMMTHQDMVSKLDPYFSAFMDPTSPLFPMSAELLVKWLNQSTTPLKSHQTQIESLSLCGYSVDMACEVCQAFYEMMIRCSSASETAHKYRIQELHQLQNIFVVNPTLRNYRNLTTMLIDNSEFLDSLSCILRKLTIIESGFSYVFLAAWKYFSDAAPGEQERFAKTFRELNTIFPKKSRSVALSLLVEKKFDEAFLVALTETDNEEEIANVSYVA